MKINHARLILWSSLILGVVFDVLFWKKAPGISFFVFTLSVIFWGYLLAYWNEVKPGKTAWFLTFVAILFSGMTFIREEPFTTFVNILLTLISLALLATSFASGIWLRYSLADTVINFGRLFISSLIGGSSLLAGTANPGTENPTSGTGTGRKKFSLWAVVRGAILAIPIVFFLALLLASADPIFSKEMERLLNIDRWMEYYVRLVIICVIAYLLSGIILYVLTKSNRTDLIGLEKNWIPLFLGFTESAIILVSVNLLFIFFVVIQFQYFFGGSVNISVEGYTFAEYARKGFGELITVAVFSLMLYLGLSTIVRRESESNQKWFAGLGVTLVGLVIVILVSSFHRLSMLEAAYGFSRLRTYSHVFMIWLGVLLSAVILLEIIQYRRGFAMAAFFILIGFGITLNVLNVDAFILNSNVNRAVSRGNLDYFYLQELSDDSVPAALLRFREVQDPEVKHLLGASLACRANGLEKRILDRKWQGYHVSFYTAVSKLKSARGELSDYLVIAPDEKNSFVTKVITPIGEKDCFSDLVRWD